MFYLYGGEVKLDFDAVKHAYRVTDQGETFDAPSVTQALGMIDKSGPLTQWAANCAVDCLRDRLKPGVAYDEVAIEEAFRDARFGFRRASKHATDVGSLAHSWIEGYLRRLAEAEGRPCEGLLPYSIECANCCKAAKEWIGEHVEVLSREDLEVKLYSRKYRYAGTFDALAKVDGTLSVIDWKSSAAIYPEYSLQLAAYAQAIKEETGWKVERWLVRLGKTDGVVEAVHYARRDQRRDFAAFLAALSLRRWKDACGA